MRKLTLVGKERAAHRLTTIALNQVRQDLKWLKEQTDSQFTRLQAAATRDAQVIADLRQIVVKHQEEAERQVIFRNLANAERDRLVRIVDQFTSVSIVPFTHSSTNTDKGTVGNRPQDLRRT